MPAQAPVHRISRDAFETVRTSSIIPNEMAVSARNAPVEPYGPGTVATKFTEGSAGNPAKSRVAATIPIVPPANCATTYAAASFADTFPSRRNVIVSAGFMCAPDRLPSGEYTMAASVSPMAMPIGIRWTSGDGLQLERGDEGCRSSVVTPAADTMNSARQAASLAYSGQ
jgi:hypothetical protein